MTLLRFLTKNNTAHIWFPTILHHIREFIPMFCHSLVVAAIYPMLAVTSRFIGENIPITWRHVIMLGGMRGAISVALVASLPPSNFKSILQTITFGVVLLSLVIQYIALSKYVRNVFNYNDASINKKPTY